LKAAPAAFLLTVRGGIGIDQMTFADFDALSERIEFYGFDSTRQRSVEDFLRRGKPITAGKRNLAKVIVLRKYEIVERKRVSRRIKWYRKVVNMIFEEKKRHPQIKDKIHRRRKKR